MGLYSKQEIAESDLARELGDAIADPAVAMNIVEAIDRLIADGLSDSMKSELLFHGKPAKFNSPKMAKNSGSSMALNRRGLLADTEERGYFPRYSITPLGREVIALLKERGQG